MNVTDLMVCGFDGERIVFSANVTVDDYTVVITSCDEMTFTSNPEQTSSRFAALLRIACDLNGASAHLAEQPSPDQRD